MAGCVDSQITDNISMVRAAVLGFTHKTRAAAEYYKLVASRNSPRGRLQHAAVALATELNIDTCCPCTIMDAAKIAKHLRIRLLITSPEPG